MTNGAYDVPVLAQAAQDYLAARARFRSSTGVTGLREYRVATDHLLAVFAETVNGMPEHVIADAFHAFRRSLVEQQDGARPRRGASGGIVH